jgi:hypothetical protein
MKLALCWAETQFTVLYRSYTRASDVLKLNSNIRKECIWHDNGWTSLKHVKKKLTHIMYEGKSVNRSQMDIKRKTCDIRTWKKHLFLNISSTNIDILVPSLYPCVETRSIQVFWLLSQLLSRLGFDLFVFSEMFATQLWTALRDKHFPR